MLLRDRPEPAPAPSPSPAPIPLPLPLPLPLPTAPPRLAPGHEPVRRGTDAVQFGVVASRAAVLDGLTPPLARVVEGLDGSRRWADVLADAVSGGAAPSTVHDVLHRLREGGLLDVRPRPAPPGRTPEVLVHGGGRVAVALACLLAAPGTCRVAVRARGAVGAEDLGTGLTAADLGRPRAAALGDALVRVRGAAGPPVRRPDLVVLADGPVADPQLVATASRVAHLPVAVRDARGVVGPLVLPGRTPCLRCDELTRADEDPAWPRIAVQLAARRPVIDVAVAGATAALAACQVLAVLAGSSPPPPVLGATVELDPRSGATDRRPHRPHPSCGCRRADGPDLRAA